jgi:hypothetical protein
VIKISNQQLSSNLNAETQETWKKYSNTTPPEINSPTITDTKDSEEENLHKDLKDIIVRMINEIKED